MKIVILCAGIGSRLEHMTKDLPKCLVKIKNKRLIDYQLDSISSLEINEIIVVTGYLSNMVREYLSNRIKFINNDIFDSTNSMYSLWLSKNS